MNNNDILRRLRYTFNFSDQKMVSIFKLAGLEVNQRKVVQWLKKEEDPSFIQCNDNQLAYFLNGLIIERRGKQEGREPVAEEKLHNNLILVKLKIALSLKSDDIVNMMEGTNLRVTKAEISAFLRKSDHRNYKKCGDQFLRNFLFGIDNKFNQQRTSKRGSDKAKTTNDKNSDIYKKSRAKFSSFEKETRKKVFVNLNAKAVEKKESRTKLSINKPKQ